jgi:hypothetical protein
MDYLKQLETDILAWPDVSVHAHRFGGKEFRFRKAEIGHVHRDGTVDIPFPRSVRDALINEGQAVGHRWVPDSGWTTFKIRGEADVAHAKDLLRLSYLRYAVKMAGDPHHFLEQESETLGLGRQFIVSLVTFALPSAQKSSSSLAGKLPSH